MPDYDREQIKTRVLEILQRHRGPDACISMTALMSAATGEHVIPRRRYDQSRIVRSIVRELRTEGHPIVHKSGPAGGYYLADTDAEIEQTARWFRSRAMSAFRQEAALRRISITDLIEQYPLELTPPQETPSHV